MSEVLPSQELKTQHFFNTKIWRIRRLFDSAMQSVWLKDVTETERALNFNDYKKHLGLEVGKSYWKMLDIGASWWDFAVFSNKYKVFPNTSIESIDFDPNFVKKWKKLWADIQEMNATDLKYPNENFDTVLSHASMPHCLFLDSKNTPDLEWANKVAIWLKETMRVIKMGGELRFRSPAPEGDDYRGEIIAQTIHIKAAELGYEIETLDESLHTSLHQKQFTMVDSKWEVIPERKIRNTTYVLKKFILPTT